MGSDEGAARGDAVGSRSVKRGRVALLVAALMLCVGGIVAVLAWRSARAVDLKPSDTDFWYAALGGSSDELVKKVGPPTWDSRKEKGDSDSEYLLRFKVNEEHYSVVVAGGVVVTFAKF